MGKLVTAIALALLASSSAAASPGLAPSVTLHGGLRLGRSDHPDAGGITGGVDLGVELQVWWLSLGGSLGAHGYPSVDGAPIQGTASAAHLGVSIPVYLQEVRGLEVRARAAVEIGRHAYAANGSERGLHLLGPDVTYDGQSRSVRFTGARAGVSVAAVGFTHSPGVVFALDVAGRRDRDTVDLAYIRTSCGGLFTQGCSTSSGMATAGGRELSLVMSLGFMFGR